MRKMDFCNEKCNGLKPQTFEGKKRNHMEEQVSDEGENDTSCYRSVLTVPDLAPIKLHTFLYI